MYACKHAMMFHLKLHLFVVFASSIYLFLQRNECILSALVSYYNCFVSKFHSAFKVTVGLEWPLSNKWKCGSVAHFHRPYTKVASQWLEKFIMRTFFRSVYIAKGQKPVPNKQEGTSVSRLYIEMNFLSKMAMNYIQTLRLEWWITLQIMLLEHFTVVRVQK